MPFSSIIATRPRFGFGKRGGTRSAGMAGGLGMIGRLLPVLIGIGSGLKALPASSEPTACRSLTGAARQDCGLAAAIPKASDTPGPGHGDAARVIAPLSADAFHAVSGDRINADPGSSLRQPIAIGPARCFYFGVGDYRCVVTAAAAVVVAAPIVIPQESQVSVEQGCGQDDPGISRPCTYRIMFVPVSTSRAGPNQGAAVVFRTPNIMATAMDGTASGTAGQP